MKLIALTGLPRSGKDTFASLMESIYDYRRFSFAGPLKEAAAILLNRRVAEMEGKDGFDREAILPEWGFTTRRFLQYLGTEAMRNFDPDFWLKRMGTALDGRKRVVISDCRFPNEVDFVHGLGGSVIRVVRPGCVDNGHISNQPVKVDFEIMNDGSIEEFDLRIHALVRSQQWQ